MSFNDGFYQVAQFDVTDKTTEYYVSHRRQDIRIGRFERTHKLGCVRSGYTTYQYYFTGKYIPFVVDAPDGSDDSYVNELFIQQNELYIFKKEDVTITFEDRVFETINTTEKILDLPVIISEGGLEKVGKPISLLTGDFNEIHQMKYPQNWQIYKKTTIEFQEPGKTTITVEFFKKQMTNSFST
jgi:hypothetical protein